MSAEPSDPTGKLATAGRDGAYRMPNRKARRRAMSKKGRADLAIRNEVAVATIRALNGLPFLKRLSFCWAMLRKAL